MEWFLLLLASSIVASVTASDASNRNSPNVVLILADDLGYGDLGFAPFNSITMDAVKTPRLERMSKHALTLTNFHVAAPVCSPSRAAILTGLFPFRLGIDFIYGPHPDQQLPMVPNLPMTLKSAGYYTAHIGKWHLGGQTPKDLARRRDSNFTDCFRPSINQYGFDEYVGMTEGQGGDMLRTLAQKNTYTTGASCLVHNDVPISVPMGATHVRTVSPGSTGTSSAHTDSSKTSTSPVPHSPQPAAPTLPTLTDSQADHAIRVIKEQHAAGRPFFVNLWFNAPHNPLEGLAPFFADYKDKFPHIQLAKYASMISNMDVNIGNVLDTLDELHISENTLVIFTSDNGPEPGQGTGGSFKGSKRELREGGIRVPAMVQWKGKIAPGITSDKFVLVPIYSRLLLRPWV